MGSPSRAVATRGGVRQAARILTCVHEEQDQAKAVARGAGEVTGGGTQMGDGGSILVVGLDVEVTHCDRGLEIIRRTMRACGAPADTVIDESAPEHRAPPL